MRTYRITLTYVVHVPPADDGTYPEGDALSAELSERLQETMANLGDTDHLDPDQYALIEEEAD